MWFYSEIISALIIEMIERLAATLFKKDISYYWFCQK
jgi:hypothetical protein